MTSESSRPKYKQLHALLLEKIRSGECKIGDRLGTEAGLTRAYGLSTTTVTRVLRDMEREGWVVRKKGEGTFVRAREPVNGPAAQGRVLLLSGRGAAVSPGGGGADLTVNWFIGYEIHRGIINNFVGQVRLADDEEFARRLGEPLAGQCGGIVIDPSAGLAERMRTAGMPCIAINRQFGVTRTDLNTVTLDRLRGIYEGLGYLIRDLGHRDIALITSGPSVHPDREFGYAATLQAFRIPFRESLVVRDDEGGTVEAGYRAMKRLIESGTSFTAALVDTDTKAFGAMRALQEAGKQVPGDVSVLGFDDIPVADSACPPLTTIRVPHYDMGAEAVRLLDERLSRAGADVQGSLLNTRLVVRASCGPKRA